MILTDNETRIDLLNNKAIADTIVDLLSSQPDRPVTVGVHGDWGAGKSSILEMIEAGFHGKADVLCLKFNGWRFQGFEDAKIALIEGIVTGLIAQRPMLTRAGEAVKNALRRLDWLKVARHAGGLAFTAFTGIPTPDQVQSIVGGLERILADPTKLATKENLQASIDGVRSVLKPSTESKNVPEEIAAFRKAFDDLLNKAGVKQLVVLVDDLDRCLPDTAIETLEAIRLFVFTDRTAFVIAADEAMIEYAVRKHFPDLPDTTGPRDYARNYLEKLIQVPFRIPALGEAETRIYVTLLLLGAEFGEDNPQFGVLLEAARDRLKRPWTSAGLDAALINTALREHAGRANIALTLSDQIGPILASGTQGNPRQIKRFLNALLLRQQTAQARGFGGDVKLPVLAKLMLAERFLSRLFDQMASAAASHPAGICEDIAVLETGNAEAAASGSDPRIATPDGVSTPSESVLASEWRSSPSIRAWAQLIPALAGVDLRPYLFVTKDRKDYFGATSVLGRLASVVEKLFGPRLAVRALEAELKQLAKPEAAQVFEAVRGRITGSATFDTEPAGIAGIAVLVRAHPSLQADLLNLLEALPHDRCGAWVVSGWEGVVTESLGSERLNGLLKKWAGSTNSVLKAAASGALRTRQGKR